MLVEIRLECLQIQDQRRRVDLVFPHAWLGGRGLEHHNPSKRGAMPLLRSRHKPAPLCLLASAR